MKKEIDRILDREDEETVELVSDMLQAHTGRDARAYARLEGEFAERVKEILAIADLLGRASTWTAYDGLRSGSFAATATAFEVPFREAVSDIVTREPRVVPPSVEDRSRWVSELYSREHAFAAARSATEKLTKRVQDALAKLVKTGIAAARTENELMELAAEEAQDWPRWYSAVVYRTNVATAYSNGRFEQARDPLVREVIGALEVVGVDDVRERPNHAAFRGLIAAVDDPVWARAKPPYGYQCRHGLDFRSIFDLERIGLVRADGSVMRREPADFAKASYDEGFRAGVF